MVPARYRLGARAQLVAALVFNASQRALALSAGDSAAAVDALSLSHIEFQSVPSLL